MGWEQQRAERDFRQNPPTDAPMQGGNSGWDSMEVGSSSVENVADSYASNINDTLNGGSGVNWGANTPQQGIHQNQMPKSAEDLAWDSAVASAKGIFKFTKLLVISFKNNKPGDWYRLGDRMIKISVGVIAVGTLGCIYKLFNPNDNVPIDCVIGGIISMIPGVLLALKFPKDDTVTEEPVQQDFNDYSSMESNDWNSNTSSGSSWDEDDWNDDSESDWGDEETSDDEWDDVIDSLDSGVDLFAGVNDSNFDANTAVESLPEVTPGAYTRQYLVESFMKVLPTVNPGYSEMHEITADCDLFYEFEDRLMSAAYQVGMKEENLPELSRLHENPFLYRLTCTRPVGMKEQAIADEIATAYSRNEFNRIYKFGSYATVETQPGVCTINIFKGFEKDAMGNQIGGVMVSLGDIYKQIMPFITNPQIQMPFVWGVNEFGEALYCDMKDNNSIIISGEPRGGKSWKGQSWVAQMCMFHSPKEIELYFFDGKNDSSDYKGLSTVLPHVKYFCGDMDKFNDGIEMIMKKMDEEVLPKITNAGFINIKDYNKANPFDKIPYTYILIDELMSLMDHYKVTNPDEAARFRGNLSTLVSKYPNSGLRFVLFPHRIVNDIIAKNTYSLVSCRVVVKQTNFDELKNALNVKEKDFPYQLAQTGDMAVKINEIQNGTPVFCHAEIVSSDNSGNSRLFKYIGAVWNKLEPECECITMHGMTGGNITINGRVAYGNRLNQSKIEEAAKERGRKVARDNTSDKESYSFMSGTGFLSMEELAMEDTAEAEDFWDDILGGNDSKASTTDAPMESEDKVVEAPEVPKQPEKEAWGFMTGTGFVSTDELDEEEESNSSNESFWDDF